MRRWIDGAGNEDIAQILDGDDAIGGGGEARLMVRGAFPEGPLMLPRPFRCFRC
jgi:hypothetical protein